jgi:hypothetical protein
MEETVIALPAEKLALPAPLGELMGLNAFPIVEGQAYVLFYDSDRLNPERFYEAVVAGQIEIPSQLLFVPLMKGQEGPAVAMAAFEDIAQWVEQVREGAREG